MRKHSSTKALVSILFLCSLVAVVLGASNGNVGQCNAKYDGFGCKIWGYKDDGTVNRMDCLDERGGIMPWATAPVPHPAYTIRSGDGPNESDDATSYTPGEYTSIFIRVLDPAYKYRGILMHAVDAQGKTVGQWGLPSDRPSYQFWHPDTCGSQYVLHVDANVKNYVNRFQFEGPPAGTGKITFHTLIKYGPANEGDFYYPIKDLVLEEYSKDAQPKDPFLNWYVGDTGEDCHTVCKKHNLHCNSKNMQDAVSKGVTNLTKLQESMQKKFPCSLPLLKDCSVGTPAALAEGNQRGSKYSCYFHDPTCSKDATPTVEDPAVGKVRCGSYSSTARRFCFCGNEEENFNLDYWKTKPGSVDVSSGSSKTSDINIAIVTLATIITSLVLSGAGHGTGQELGSFLLPRGPTPLTMLFLTTLVSLTFFIPQCDAHNWVGTPSRGRSSAAVVCPPHKPGKWHYQVGPDQDFFMGLASGHGGWITMFLVEQKDEWRLANRQKIQWAIDYVENAPAGANTAKDFPRTHKSHRPTPILTNLKDGKGNRFYKRKIPNTDPKFKLHPGKGRDPNNFNHMSNTGLYEYQDFRIERDQRVSYASEKYPWLHAVYRYPILWHQPHDHQVLNMRLPKRLKFGHYVLHYSWKGYKDCIDIEYRTEKTTWPYGEQGAEDDVDWMKIDHCQFKYPKGVVTPCKAVDTTAKPCTDFIEDFWTKGRENRNNKQKIMGVNVVPLKNPKGVVSYEKPNIPWDNHMCLIDNDFIAPIAGTETRSDTEAFKTFAQGFTELSEHFCAQNLDLGTTTLQDATLKCAAQLRQYSKWLTTKLTYKGKNIPIADLLNIPRNWKCCRATSEISQRGAFDQWSVLTPPTVTAPTPINGQPEHVFSFQSNETAETGATYYDVGKVYQQQGSVTFGWNCEIPNEDFYANADVGSGKSESFVSNLQNYCPGTQTPKEWNFLLPEGPGLYKVKWYSNNKIAARGMRGCLFENELMTQARKGMIDSNPAALCGNSGTCPDPMENEIMVFDDKFTFSVLDKECGVMNWLSVKKINSRFTPSYYPSSSDPWWQKELTGGSHKVGKVSITTDGYGYRKKRDSLTFQYHTCSSRWLFEGDWCRHLNDAGREIRYAGTFKHGGFTVSLADAPCDPVSLTCPSAKYVCGTVKTPEKCFLGGGARMCPLVVDCGGRSAKYVRIQLHGDRRIFSANVNVYPSETPSPPASDMLCYGVEGRDATLLYPEFEMTEDPDDPMFYSTCYVRGTPLKWLPREGLLNDNTGNYIFGEKCLTCGNAKTNANLEWSSSNPLFPRWEFSDVCNDCAYANSLDWTDPDIVKPHPDGNRTKPNTKSEEEKQKEKEVAQHQTTVICLSIFIPLSIILVIGFLVHRYHLEPYFKKLRRKARYYELKALKMAEEAIEKEKKLFEKKTGPTNGDSDSESSDSESDGEEKSFSSLTDEKNESESHPLTKKL